MANAESNGHVTDDVTWPRKIKAVTPICLGPVILKTAGDRDTVPKDHEWEMAYGRSNGQVLDEHRAYICMQTFPWDPIHGNVCIQIYV